MKRNLIMMTALFVSFPFIQSFAAEIKTSATSDSVRNIPVTISVSNIPEEQVKAVRAVDGEQPVTPVNINIGLSKLTLYGYAQTTYTYSKTADTKTNGFNISRIMLMANAELTQQLSFFLMYDANKSVLHEYYAQYAFSPALKIRIGQYKQPFTLESIISPSILNNINYDACVLYLAGISSDPCQGDHVGRDLGLMLTGEAIKYKSWNLVDYSISVFNGPGMNQKENNNQKDVIGMLNVTPLKGVMLSTSFLLGTGHAQADNEYGAFKTGDNYKRQRWAIGTEIKTTPAYFRSEYLIGNDGGIHSKGYYANAEFHLSKKFDLIANYDYLKKNNELAESVEHNYMFGAQYWLYKRCRILSEFVYKTPKIGNDTRMWITQFQIRF